MEKKKDIFDEMVAAFPFPKVLTSKIAEFTFGLLSGKRLSNLASSEGGTPEPIKVGRKNFYDAHELAAWLRERYPQYSRDKAC